MNHGVWDLWVAVCGLMKSAEDVWLNVFFRGFLNTLARELEKLTDRVKEPTETWCRTRVEGVD